MELLHIGNAKKLFDAVASGTANSTVYALPVRGTLITWQTSFGSAPASITLQLQTSLDNLSWSTVDTSTSTTGEDRTINTAALFVRARINAISGGSGITVQVDCKDAGVVTSALVDGTFLTSTDETASLTSSRQLIAGTNVTFDDTVSGERTIDATLPATLAGTFLTVDDDTATLPDSRQLLAGSNITFNDATPGQRTIASTPSAGALQSVDFLFTEIATAANVSYAIVAVNVGTQTFSVAGDHTADFIFANAPFAVVGSTGNDAVYHLNTATFNIGTSQTDIVTQEAFIGAIADGVLRFGRYRATFDLPANAVVYDTPFWAVAGPWAADASRLTVSFTAVPQWLSQATPSDPVSPISLGFTGLPGPSIVTVSILTAINGASVTPAGITRLKVMYFTPITAIDVIQA